MFWQRKYRFLVEREDMKFEISFRAPNDRVAQMRAASIGFALGLLLIGPL